MNPATGQAIRARARHRCEYCQFPEAFSELPFHLDHVIAHQHGGEADYRLIGAYRPSAEIGQVEAMPAQGKASSTSLAFLLSMTGAGSNQRASASLALAMASASVSPAVAPPGNS